MVQNGDLSAEQVKELSLRMGAAAMSGANPDAISSLGVGTAMLLGLLAKKRGAPGQATLTTMLTTVGHFLSEDIIEYQGRPAVAAVDGDFFGLSALYRLYETSQGWVFLASATDREWARLVSTLGSRLGEIPADGSLATASGRRDAETRLAAELDRLFRTAPARQWEQELTAAGIACVEVADGPSDATLFDGEGALGRRLGLIVEREHPVLGQYPRIRSLLDYSRSATLAPATPALGEHTESVLEELGYTTEQIADLRARGVVGG